MAAGCTDFAHLLPGNALSLVVLQGGRRRQRIAHRSCL